MEHINGYGVSYTSSACLLKAIKARRISHTHGPCACLPPASMDFMLTASTLYGDGFLNLSHLRGSPALSNLMPAVCMLRRGFVHL